MSPSNSDPACFRARIGGRRAPVFDAVASADLTPPQMALMSNPASFRNGLLIGVNRKWRAGAQNGAFDPQRTSTERAHEQHRSQLRAESFADFTTWVGRSIIPLWE